jgi:integrase/recombinase XerD
MRSRATPANRRLTVFKRYFRWALRERRMAVDPTLKLQAARQPLRVPKTLTEAQVEALLAAPDVSTPLGLRDRTMLELMYASGLRVSELVGLKTLHVSMSEGVLRVHGQGQQGAAGAVWRGGPRLGRALPGPGTSGHPGGAGRPTTCL